MQILPVSLNNNNSFGFKAKLMHQQSVGMLQRTTSYNMEGILHAYREIMTKLSRKTEEGLNFIRKNYPNVTIGEGLTFHNCGPNKTSILIRCAEDPMYMGLTRIIVREGQTFEASRRVKDSFMLYNHDKAVTNFDEKHSKQFPKESRLATAEELQKLNYDERLSAVLKDLDEAMLPFRIFLSKNSNLHCKNPDGIIPCKTKEYLFSIDKLIEEIVTISEKIPRKKLLNLNKNYSSYVPTTGQQAYEFCNLGSDKISVICSNIESSRHDNLKRLIVSDKDGNRIAGYLIKDNEKLVKNTNPKTLVIPDKLSFLDSTEINDEKLMSDLNKYLEIYSKTLEAYKSALLSLIEPEIKIPPLKLHEQTEKDLSDSKISYEEILKILKKFENSSDYSSLLKQNGIKYVSATKGIIFNDYNGNQQVYLLPVKSKKYPNLIRLTITNSEGNNQKMYLIKDFKYIVKNFNPKYPEIIPKTPVYAEENPEIAEYISDCSKYLVKKLQSVIDLVSNQPDTQKRYRSERLAIKTDNPEYNNLVKECLKEFKYAMKNINSLGEFQKTMNEINQKVAEYHKNHHS